MVEPTVVPENKRLLVAICYVLPLIGGIVLFLIAEGNRILRFHAFQAIVLGLIVWILGAISVCLAGFLGFLLWLYCLYGAYLIYTQGDWRSFVANFVDDSLMK
ncbi:MAG TPA: hypothetical protein VGJ92_09140 [Methanocella sp.]|jgi:uncharacterized membrane protein